MEYAYVGIDVGKSFSVLCILDDEANLVCTERIPTLQMNAWRDTIKLCEGRPVKAAFEIGPHYEWLYDLLSEFCEEVQVVNALDFSILSKSQRKTDKIDAQKLAEGLWRGDLPLVYVPDKRMRKDRRLVAQIHLLSREIARLKTRIRETLYVARIECPYSNILGSAAQAWLQEILPTLDDQERLFTEMQLDRLNLYKDHYNQLTALATQRLKSYPDIDIARSIPGFGHLVSLAMLSAIGNVIRFETPDELTNYFGLCGSIMQSGKSLYQGRITKRGNKHARWLLGQAVTHLIRRDSKARKRYMKLKKKKRSKVARVAVMRWIVAIFWRMLQKKELYRLGGVPGCHLSRAAKKVA